MQPQTSYNIYCAICKKFIYNNEKVTYQKGLGWTHKGCMPLESFKNEM